MSPVLTRTRRGGTRLRTAQAEHLVGSQWGMMNETGSDPGQVWLWLYTFWYQIKPFSTSENADALVWGVMAVLSLAFICMPFVSQGCGAARVACASTG
jgi:hypothetical protein